MIVLHIVLFAICLYGLFASVVGKMPFLTFLNTLCAGFNFGMALVYILEAVK